MHRHRYFDLRLHSDEELAPLVQGDILERVTLHEWPLSCVQRLITSDGRKLIYKAQSGPTVESEFYANARSSLLAPGKTIYKSDGHVCMLIELVEGPSIEDLDLSEEEVVRIARAVMGQIAGIAGELPYVVDVSTEERWRKLAEATLKGVETLIDQGKFRLVDKAAVRDLERWASSRSVLSAIRKNPGYIHGDLTGGNVFVLQDGYRVIDWQFPRLGPTDLDLATLMESLGFDPLRHVGVGVVGVMYFLRIHWFAQCAVRWIPEGVETYDQQIGSLVAWAERIGL